VCLVASIWDTSPLKGNLHPVFGSVSKIQICEYRHQKLISHERRHLLFPSSLLCPCHRAPSHPQAERDHVSQRPECLQPSMAPTSVPGFPLLSNGRKKEASLKVIVGTGELTHIPRLSRAWWESGRRVWELRDTAVTSGSVTDQLCRPSEPQFPHL
jgi:hypothetical protein